MAFAAIAALSSCSQSEEFALDNGQSSYDKNAVTFGTYLGQSPKTRATVTDIDVMKGDTYPGFGVFAYNTGTDNFADVSSTATPNFMCNVPVKWNNSVWAYTDEKQWPDEGKVSFFAYAPHIATPDAMNITALPGETATGAPVISFKVAEKVADQIDLLYADAKTDQTKETNGGKVQFSFKHALSRIGFKAKLDGEVSGDIKSITITNIVLKSSALSVSAKLNLQTGEWSDHAAKAAEYTLGVDDFTTGNNEFAPANAGNDPVQLNDVSKYLMLIPTGKDSKATMEIAVNYVEETTDGTKTVYNVPVTFEQAFEPGKAYNFVLAISLTSSGGETGSNVQFDVMEVIPWNSPDSNEGTDVSITPESDKIGTLILHPASEAIKKRVNVAEFINGSSRFVVKMGHTGETVTFAIPKFNLTFPDQSYDKTYPYVLKIDYNGVELHFLGWSEEAMDLLPEDDDNNLEYWENEMKDKLVTKVEIKEGEVTNLYPVVTFSDR